MSKKSEGNESIVKTRAGGIATRLIADAYKKGWAHVEAGKPVAWLMYGPNREILRCFDILPVYPESYASNCAIKQQTSPYIEYAEEEGFSEYICGYLRHAMGYALSLARGDSLEIAPFGGMPRPSMLLSCSRLCDPRTKVFETMRRYLKVPAFIYDHQIPPTEDDRCNDPEVSRHYIEHNLEGLKGLVKFLEELTGIKLDRDRLSEMVRNSIESWHLMYECFALRKHSPCPLPLEDLVVVYRPFRDMIGERETVEFFRDLRDEIAERVRLGTTVVPEEKHRLLWLGLPMWFDMDLLTYIESKGGVVVMDSMYHCSKPVPIDTSDPLRALAEKEYWGWDMYGNSDGSQPRCGLTTGSYVLDMVRDYTLDGVIVHSVISCRGCTIGNRHIARVLREEMGIPVMEVESHMTNLSAYSTDETREKIDAFLHMLSARKRGTHDKR
jgi:benzoyl-CoA reductase/2-hydroxyglutaryl-CoA dehydratase subunit BcrC/BadD/HgdB